MQKVVRALLIVAVALGTQPVRGQNQPARPVDPVYEELRDVALSGETARVAGLTLTRDVATFKFQTGDLYFFTPVQGRVTGAVFIGDGTLSVTPGLECEKRSMAIYTKASMLNEPFSELVLRFSDTTYDEIKKMPSTAVSSTGAPPERAHNVFADHTKMLRERLHMNLASRTLEDVYANAADGYFIAFIKGKTFPKLIFMLDPRGIADVAPEQVMLLSHDNSTGGIWMASRLAGDAGRIADARTFDIKKHAIDVTINGTDMSCADRVTLETKRDGVRVLAFDLFPSLRVSKVSDADGHDLGFIQQAKDDDAALAVILPAAAPAGSILTLTFEYKGNEALYDSGGGNFILIPRSTWYPNNGSTAFGDRAYFEMRFRIPENLVIVGTGRLSEPETKEAGLTISKWTSDVELAVAGFNYGRFKQKVITDPVTGYTLEFYANKDVPDDIKRLQHTIEELERSGQRTDTTLGSISTTRMADTVLADAQNATRIYEHYFGKLHYSRIAMSQQPAMSFGQAWPTLVFMPYTAYLDTTIRTQLLGVRGGTDSFWRYVGPHEVAHQWWGHMVGWTSYRDQWMSEGFAEFSASLYVEQVRGVEKFIEFWEAHRKQITQASPATEGKVPYTIGAVTQGHRLSGAKTGAVYQFLVYPKGAYILHMLRMLMWDPKTGDAAFKAMMQDFLKSHYNAEVSTEDFKATVEKHMLPFMNMGGDGTMNWFFDQWVYGTEMPRYTLEYSFQDRGGKPVFVGKLSQSNVNETFRMAVPLYLDFGKGWARLGRVTLTGNSSQSFEVPLPQRPKRATVNALNDVLCLDSTITAGK
jgi:hypothetical protein